MSDLATAAPTSHAPLGRPRPGRLITTDLVAAATALTGCLVGLWSAGGGLEALADEATRWRSLSQLSGLLASELALLALVLVARPRGLERLFGLDRLFIWHRWLGEATAVLVAAHVAVSIVDDSTAVGSTTAALSELTGELPYMAMATVGAVLIGVVTLTSLRRARRHLAYETWYFLHLLAYLGLALAFAHEITLGTNLSDGLGLWFWIGLHVAVLALLVVSRWGRLLWSMVRPLRVVASWPASDDTVALTLAGGRATRLQADAGQFFFLRPLRRHLWWQSHPYSLSAAPTRGGLRFTVKDRGDASGATARMPVGTFVAAEGPYGVHTPDVLGDEPVLFIVGGVGVAPVRSMLERLGARARPIVLYRARRAEDLVHLDEIAELATARGGSVHTLVGPTATLATQDPFGADELRAAVPDLTARVAVLCGPDRLLHAASRGLRAAGLPKDRIHFERAWW